MWCGSSFPYFSNHLVEEEMTGCFALIVMFFFSSVSLPRRTMVMSIYILISATNRLEDSISKLPKVIILKIYGNWERY